MQMLAGNVAESVLVVCYNAVRLIVPLRGMLRDSTFHLMGAKERMKV